MIIMHSKITMKKIKYEEITDKFNIYMKCISYKEN